MRRIKVKNQFIGFHKYVDAPEQVKFLRDLHRHVFHVTSTLSVDHNNRDLEFFIVQRAVQEIIDSWIFLGKEEASCEDIAEYILDYLEMAYPKSAIEIEVSEDGENSGIINNYERFHG